jgi:predicted Zn-dependent protease with MMP-like domain
MIPVSRADFDLLVAEALDTVPPQFHRYLDNVAVVVEEEPSREDRDKLGLGRGETLFGLYRGTPLTKRDANFAGLPDTIVIFRGPILRACWSRADAVAQIRATVLHEVGHLFGLSDEQLP